MIFRGRQTRSAAKILGERKVMTTAATEMSLEKPNYYKRKIRKRKLSKSIDRSVETSDDENTNPPSNFALLTNNRKKTKRHKKPKSNPHSDETFNNDNNNNQQSIKEKLKTQNRNKLNRNDRPEMFQNIKNTKGTHKQIEDQETTAYENKQMINFTKNNKSKLSMINNEEKKLKTKKKIKETKSLYLEKI